MSFFRTITNGPARSGQSFENSFVLSAAWKEREFPKSCFRFEPLHSDGSAELPRLSQNCGAAAFSPSLPSDGEEGRGEEARVGAGMPLSSVFPLNRSAALRCGSLKDTGSRRIGVRRSNHGSGVQSANSFGEFSPRGEGEMSAAKIDAGRARMGRKLEKWLPLPGERVGVRGKAPS